MQTQNLIISREYKSNPAGSGMHVKKKDDVSRQLNVCADFLRQAPILHKFKFEKITGFDWSAKVDKIQ